MANDSTPQKKPRWLAIIGPGLLIAATGVGAGDLASAGFAGSHLGTAVLWAVLVGAFLKFVLTEGLTRWQLVSGQSLLEGMSRRLGRVSGWLFLPYLVIWSFFVASALMSACGVTLHAIWPVFEDANRAKVVFGIASSLIGLLLVFRGGFRLFEKVMSVCIGIMFFTVVISAMLLMPDAGEVLKGLLIPRIPGADGAGVPWTLALIGGVGGTVTILCYGYWIAEEGRIDVSDLKLCRVDLGIGYLMTALFGIAMVIIGSTVQVKGSGAGLIIEVANSLETSVGPIGRWLFLAGALGAVFSSLLGVWQAVPYLFADLWRLFFSKQSARENPAARIPLSTGSLPYRAYLVGIAFLPMAGLFFQFREIQKLYGIIGATFIPLLAIVLLILNGSSSWVGSHTNRLATVLVLISTLIFFAWLGWTV